MKGAFSVICLSGLALTVWAAPAGAFTPTYWIQQPDTPGDWFEPSNWDNGVPTSIDYWAYISNGGTAEIAAPGAAASYLYLGEGGGGSGEVTLSTGGELLTNSDYVGHDGAGSFVHTGGTHVVNDELYLGYEAGGSGTYQLGGTGELWAAYEYVSCEGSGQFVQTGGVNTVTQELRVGAYYAYGQPGSYDLIDGELRAETVILGDYAAGTFTQSGGSCTVNADLYIGPYLYPILPYIPSTYNLSGGSLSAGTIHVGRDHPGELNWTGGTIQTGAINVLPSGTINIGQDYYNTLPLNITGGVIDLGFHDFIVDSGTSSGSFLTYNAVLSAAGQYIGRSGSGSFTHTGGANTANCLILGLNSSGSGSYQLTGTGDPGAETHLVTGTTIVGYDGAGSFTQDGGKHTAQSALILGRNAPGNGTYALNDGTLTARDNVFIGLSGSGSITQSGGTCTVNEDMILGRFSGSDGAYVLSAGSLEVQNLYVGMDGAGSLEITDPAGQVAVSGKLRFGPLSSLSAVEGSAIHMTGADLENASTDPLALAGLGNLELIFEGGAQAIDALEAAGEDMGAVTAGWTDNFALFRLTLGGADAGRIRLVDNSDNQPAWEGAEAVYVDGLTLNPGATIDLNGLKLYYLNDGPPKQFFCGDVNLDGAVNGGDYSLWADHYLLGGMSWGEGDLNGDGVVDGGDFTLWADDYGSATVAAIPEPAALALLAIGAVALIRRRRG